MATPRPRITELYEYRILISTRRNKDGQSEKVRTALRCKRRVHDLPGRQRLLHLVADSALIYLLTNVFKTLTLAVLPIVESIILMGILGFVFSPLYYLFMELYFQQTVGKRVTRSVVVDAYGNRPDARTIFLRTLIRCIPFEPLSFLFTNRGWHDRWTDTYVMRIDEVEKVKTLMKSPENLKP